MKREVEILVLAHGEYDQEVEDHDEGGQGGVAGDPEPLQVPGILFINLHSHLQCLLSDQVFL